MVEEMNSRLVSKMIRNPKALMEHAATGRYSRTQRIKQTPLMLALEAIGPRARQSLIGFTVGPQVGYTRQIQFRSAEAAYRWIGGYQGLERLACEAPSPGQAAADARFNKRLSWSDLKGCVSGPVGDELVRVIELSLRRF
jgi:hypothetical protein